MPVEFGRANYAYHCDRPLPSLSDPANSQLLRSIAFGLILTGAQRKADSFDVA